MESDNRKGAYSLAFGIAGFMPVFGVLLGILAIVKGIAGISDRDESRALSITGVVLGILSIIFNVFFFIFYVMPFMLVGFLFWVCCLQFAEV